MLSLSVAFHIGSVLVLLVLMWRLAVYRRWIALFRKWSDPRVAGIVVGEPFAVIRDFAGALDLPCEGSEPRGASATKISLEPLFKLHAVCGIKRIDCTASDNPEASFVVSRSSATIEEDQRSIERAFSNRLRVSIVVAT